MTTTTSIVPKVQRGDVVLLPIQFVRGTGSKVRPAVVVQNDSLNSRLESTVVAVVTSTNVRRRREPSQLLVDVTTPEGGATGLLYASTVKCEHLDTIDQANIIRRMGRFGPALLQQLEVCLKAALEIS